MLGTQRFILILFTKIILFLFVSPRHALIINKIREENLKDLLTDLEWTTIMGTSNTTLDYSVVWPRYQYEKSNEIKDSSSGGGQRRRRRWRPRWRRSILIHNNNKSQHPQQQQQRRIVLHADSLKRTFDLRLKPSPKLVANDFQLVARWNNRTRTLPYKYDDECFYTDTRRTAALTICAGNIRGIISSDDNEYYVIYPMPVRFRSKSKSKPSTLPHIIVRRPISSSMTESYDNNINKVFKHQRARRASPLPPLESPVFVETAVFVDSDLFQHMHSNYARDTEREVVRFVLAMINAVQLLYHDPSLGRPVNFVLKRLEILHEDPSGLTRPPDIDRFLSNFCIWQRTQNPPGDQDPGHWDHALILTGLDLYVVSKHGKASSQVVGLAPVAGMCTTTSSCTVNEGRHFESVYVVAHEIGHNLGMRHDGPLADNDCDPSSYIMSPTLGSGKITWSSCSRRYLQKFLETTQSRCLLDHSSSAGQLDHSAEGALPGERFDADQQCMLKYGKGSKHSLQQPLDDICRDLHCQRERYTWTSHPALEGTICGYNMWCRGGRCITRSHTRHQEAAPLAAYKNHNTKSSATIIRVTNKDLGWSEWKSYNDCASGCLYGEEGRLRAGSTGILISTRKCNHKSCRGPNKRYETCSASQCLNVPRITIREFAIQICERAKQVDRDLTGSGLQKINSLDPEEACMIWCLKRNGSMKNRGWTFPDGTVCQTRNSHLGKRPTYCVNGRCQEFECKRNNDDNLEFIQQSDLCPSHYNQNNNNDNDGNELIWHNNHNNKKSHRRNAYDWISASGCHFNCMNPGTGIRLVVNKQNKQRSSIQLCQPDPMSCGRIKTPFQHATTICTKYKERVRKLSGFGMQISAAIEDPDRPCRVACQDERVSYRFYLVNGEDGWFPFGTDCSRGTPGKKAQCISGKCLEFGGDDTPLSENEFTLPLLSRVKRSFVDKQNVTRVFATLQQHDLDTLISQLNRTLSGKLNADYIPGDTQSKSSLSYGVDLRNPIHVEMNLPSFSDSDHDENEVNWNNTFTAKYYNYS